MKWGVIALIAAVLGGAGYYYWSHRPGPVPTTPRYANDRPCPGKTQTLVMKDPNLGETLKQGEQFDVLTNWYGCHAVERGDLVLYRFSETRDPVVRIARGIPGDRFHLVQD